MIVIVLGLYSHVISPKMKKILHLTIDFTKKKNNLIDGRTDKVGL